jgi:hypothetical protein
MRKFGLAGATGIAVASAALLGATPTVTSAPALMAEVHYLPATRYGDFRPEAEYVAWANVMIAGGGVTGGTPDYVDYPASFWPLSYGGLSDPTFDSSVNTGVANLTAAHPENGDVVFGYSQGAVVASKYKATNPNTNLTYVLVENPNRAGGGILERFAGLHIPILDVSFDGATVDNGAPTVDISRQYDGWSDFPKYPLNLLATANAIAGIVYLHSQVQNITDPDVLTALKESGDPTYYQVHGNTTYYLIPTEELPILMPLNGIVPTPILDALDAPLRAIIEQGYDRTDYSAPQTAELIPAANQAASQADTADTATDTAKATAQIATVTTEKSTSAPKTSQATAKARAPKAVSAAKQSSQQSAAPGPTRATAKAPGSKKSSRAAKAD